MGAETSFNLVTGIVKAIFLVSTASKTNCEGCDIMNYAEGEYNDGYSPDTSDYYCYRNCQSIA
jgi:hypothetical protein